MQEAMRSFLSQGLLGRFTCEPEEGEAVEISGLEVSCEIKKEENQPVVTVSIQGQGRLKTGQADSATEKYRLEEKLEQGLAADLQETAGRMQEELGIDMTDSYLLLGGHNRELYQEYQGLAETYHRKVRQVFQVDIEVLNWE